MPMSAKPPDFTLLGAAGAMGMLFARELTRAGGRVHGYDLHPPADASDLADFTIADALQPPAEVLAKWNTSHAVIVCLPHGPAMSAIRAVLPGASPQTLVIDTFSVKSPVHELLASIPYRCEYLSLNPMFAPSL